MTRKKGFISLMIYFWGAPLLGTVVTIMFGLSTEQTESFLFFTILMIILGAILTKYNWQFVKQQFSENLTKKETYKYGILGMGALLLVAIINAMIFQAIDPTMSLTPDNEAELDTMFADVPKLAIIFLTGLIVPFVEELVFRAGIMGIITRNQVKASYWPYILCSLAFALLHDTSVFSEPSLQNLYFFSMYFVPAIVLSIFYKLSNHNLLAVYIIHMINNIIGSL